MCPGPAHIKKAIALLSDDGEIENCLVALATSKILGAKIGSVRFFIGEDEEQWTKSHMDDDFFDSGMDLVSEEEEPKLQNCNELIITPERPNDSRHCEQGTTNERCCKGVLKSPHSPTFGEKKSVRFADSVGLKLEEIKLYIRDEDSSESDSDYEHPPEYQSLLDVFYGTTEDRRHWNPFLQRSAA